MRYALLLLFCQSAFGYTLAIDCPDTGGGCSISGPAIGPGTCSYTYTDWGACSGGQQTRSVLTANPPGCSGTPVTTQSCGGPVACTYTYSAWGACQPSNTQFRTVLSATPAGCTGTPTTQQGCQYVPPTNTCVSVDNGKTYTLQPFSPWGGGALYLSNGYAAVWEVPWTTARAPLSASFAAYFSGTLGHGTVSFALSTRPCGQGIYYGQDAGSQFTERWSLSVVPPTDSQGGDGHLYVTILPYNILGDPSVETCGDGCSKQTATSPSGW